jgi:hypothetical protein
MIYDRFDVTLSARGVKQRKTSTYHWLTAAKKTVRSSAGCIATSGRNFILE